MSAYLMLLCFAGWFVAGLVVGIGVGRVARLVEENEPIPYMPVERGEEFDRHVAEAVAFTQMSRFDQPVVDVIQRSQR